MAKRTLDAFLDKSPSKGPLTKVPRLKNSSTSPTAKDGARTVTDPFTSSRNPLSTKKNPVPLPPSPSPSTRKEEVIVIDSDDEVVQELLPNEIHLVELEEVEALLSVFDILHHNSTVDIVDIVVGIGIDDVEALYHLL